MEKIKILILAANPKNTDRLRLDEEVREIEQSLERSRTRERFQIIPKSAVRVSDLRRSLLDHEPQILHFSGYGAGERGLVFEDEGGKAKKVSTAALAGLLKSFQVNCVVLNACYSEQQAEAISRHTNYVMGMNQAIGTQAAIAFAVGFYDALGAGRSIEDAFEIGRNSLNLESLPEAAAPVLKRRDSEAIGDLIGKSKSIAAPITLLDEKVPVVAIAMPGAVYEKVLSNAQEAEARDARLIGVTPMNDSEAEEVFDNLLPVPAVEELLSPILTVIPLQFLAYHIAARRGLDVDQPRNLAKSVTVE